MSEIDYLVIKLTSGDGAGVPVGLTVEPPMLYLTLKSRYPTVQFSDVPNPSETEPYWYGVFEWAANPEPRFHTKDSYTKSYRADGVTKHSDNIWRPTFTEIPATAQEIQERTEVQVAKIKKSRDMALRWSDFSQGADAPDYVKNNIAAWNQYRQELRDLSQQSGFPWVDLPTQPSK